MAASGADVAQEVDEEDTWSDDAASASVSEKIRQFESGVRAVRKRKLARIAEFEDEIYFDDAKKNEVLVEEARRIALEESDEYKSNFSSDSCCDEFENAVYFDGRKKNRILMEETRKAALRESKQYTEMVSKEDKFTTKKWTTVGSYEDSEAVQKFEEEVYLDSDRKNEILIEELRREAAEKCNIYSRLFKNLDEDYGDDDEEDEAADDEDDRWIIRQDFVLLIVVCTMWLTLQLLFLLIR